MKVIAAIIFITTLVVGLTIWAVRVDPLRSALNAAIPPVSIETRRNISMNTALAALASMEPANVIASIDLKDVENLLSTHKGLKEYGIEDVTLQGDQQLLKFVISFKRQFTSRTLEAQKVGEQTATIPDNLAAIGKMLDVLKPQVVGTLTAYLGITSGTSKSASAAGVINLKLLPVFKSVHVESVSVLDGDLSLTEITKVISTAINAYADNVTGMFSSIEIMKIKVPTAPFDEINPSRTLIARGPNDAPIKVTVSGNPATSPVVISAVAWVIDHGRVMSLARLETDLVKGQEKLGDQSTPDAANAEQIHSALQKHIDGFFGDAGVPEGSWAGISKGVLSHSLNSIFNQVKPCASLVANLPRDEYSKEIPFPDESTINCTPSRECSNDHISCSPSRDCSNDNISCPLNVDSQPCRRCTRYKILQFRGFRTTWDWTETCINEPACEIAKATRNRAYELQKLACETGKSNWKLDCERIKGQEKLTCEANKVAWKVDCERIKGQDKLLCETKKEGLKRLARTGKFGRINVSYAGSASLNLCIKSAAIGSQLENASLQLSVSGRGDLDTHVKFTPLDIIGHITCQAPWTEAEAIHVTLPAQSPTIKAGLRFMLEDGIPRYRIDLESFRLRAKLQPNPLNYLLNSKNFMLSCPLLSGMLAPIQIPLQAALTITSEFDKEIKGSFEFVPELPQQEIGGAKIKGAIQERGSALILVRQKDEKSI